VEGQYESERWPSNHQSTVWPPRIGGGVRQSGGWLEESLGGTWCMCQGYYTMCLERGEDSRGW